MTRGAYESDSNTNCQTPPSLPQSVAETKWPPPKQATICEGANDARGDGTSAGAGTQVGESICAAQAHGSARARGHRACAGADLSDGLVDAAIHHGPGPFQQRGQFAQAKHPPDPYLG